MYPNTLGSRLCVTQVKTSKTRLATPQNPWVTADPSVTQAETRRTTFDVPKYTWITTVTQAKTSRTSHATPKTLESPLI